MSRLRIGTKVVSKPVGLRTHFRGVIAETRWAKVGKRKQKYFHVRDDEGREWHRTEEELSRALG